MRITPMLFLLASLATACAQPDVIVQIRLPREAPPPSTKCSDENRVPACLDCELGDMTDEGCD